MGLASAWLTLAAGASAAPAADDDLLFQSNRSENRFDFYRMSGDGRRAQPVLAQAASVDAMAWSPDGRHVLYTATRPGSHQTVYVTSLVDGSTRQLSHDAAPNMEPTWSADGKSVAYVSFRGGSRKIYLVNVDGSNERRLTRSQADDELSPRFSPDGSRVAYLIGSTQFATRVAVADLRSGEAGMVNPAAARSIESSAEWSPDGRQLLFGAKRGEGVQLVVMGADGSARRQLTPDAERAGQAQWSPDGQQIVYLAVAADAARQGLYVMNSDGTGRRKVHGGDHDIMSARWSANGQRIFFIEHLPAGGQIFSIGVDGADLRKLSGGEGFDVNIQVCCNRVAAQRVSAR